MDMSVQETKEYSLRTYRQGDEEELILLFNKVYEDFAGFVPRTLEYWRWCILSRPSLSEEGIVVASNDSQVVGYAAVEKSGNILEFCYDPGCEGKTVVSKLLGWCVSYAVNQNANSVTLNASVQDDVVREICEESEFTEKPFPSLFLRVLDIPYIFRKIIDQKNVEKRLNEKVLLDLRRFPSWCPRHVAIVVQDGHVSVLSEKLKHPTIKVETDISTVSFCIFGSKRTLYKAILNRRLRIRPLRKILRAVKILSLFQLNNPPWFVPGADYG